MYKKQGILTILLMLIGVCNITAQTRPNGQMDERFNDNKLPYGWFTEGWEVKDNVAKKKSMSFDFDIDLSGITNNNGEKTDQSENPEESGTQPGTQSGTQTNEGSAEGSEDGSGQQGGTEIPDIDIASLLGGGTSYNFLMTPPLNVQKGEVLSFSAKKGGADALSSFISSEDTDSTFIVERAKYGDFKWVKVADLTTELDTLYKTFTISNTEAGDYRFRFRAGGNVLIDSVAGFHIDTNAPDIYPIYQKKNIQPIDLGVCTQDTTLTFSIINTGTGTLNLDLNIDETSIYSLDQTKVNINAADTVDVNLTFHYGKSRQGRNSTLLTFKASDKRINEIPLPIDAVTSQPGVWVDNFNQNRLSQGWFTDGWEAKEGVATIKKSSGDGLGSLLGGSGTTYYLMTPPLTVNDENDVLLFSVKKPGSGGSMDIGSLLGSGSSGSSFYIEKSVYGSGKWEKAKDFTEALDTVFTTQWLSGLEPGEYRFRFMASDSIVIDSVAGFKIDQNAPDLYVTLNSAVVSSVDLGMLRADSTQTFTVINTGTGTLGLNVSSLDNTRLAIKNANLQIASGDSVFVGATMLRDDERQGEVRELLTFTPDDERVNGQSVAFHAYIIKSDAWNEDFETEYVVEDDTYPRMFPEGWTTTGWKLTQGGADDLMSLFGGSGDNEEKSWVATTDSKEYELVTPRLQAKKGHLMSFNASFTLDLMSLLGMGTNSYLNVYFKRDADKDWTLLDTYFKSDTIVVSAPYSGFCQLKFQGSGVSLDNFYGFSLPKDSVEIVDGGYLLPEMSSHLATIEGQTWNVVYKRKISADNGDGTSTPVASTVCLPYDFNIDDYYEPGTAKIYQMAYADTIYMQFIFKEMPDNLMEAGKPYMIVVNRGDVQFNAVDAKMTSKVAEGTPVYDFTDWYWYQNESVIGTWNGTYDAFYGGNNQYAMGDDGSWGRLWSHTWIRPMRAFLQGNEEFSYFEFRQNPDVEGFNEQSAETSARRLSTRFFDPENSDGEVTEIPNLLYLGDVNGNTSTGISPAIHTIDRDGTHNYFDLQGRRLSGKPDKGIYIQNGKKHVAR